MSTVVQDDVTAGAHVISWNGCDLADRPLASGVYFARLRVQTPQGERTLSRKVNLLR